MKELLEYLYSLKAGPVSDINTLIDILVPCWHEIDDSGLEGMEADKLYRIEKANWDPPILRFKIERHGGTVHGSTRADVQQWEINVKEMKAHVNRIGHRQIIPMQPRLDVSPIAEEIVKLIIDRKEDGRLKWNKDGNVRILISEIIPKGLTVQQTLAGRRKRFRSAVDERLTESGWKKISHNRYSPPAS
ncbi:hypothetical protein MYX76_15700 [Desulfobacterota bacterium AH_259_B03_O07]|nr:hypothetical protein [Desulfobacterota bacterium AH_259_B03_O07]